MTKYFSKNIQEKYLRYVSEHAVIENMRKVLEGDFRL